jgi:hypothetical protein
MRAIGIVFAAALAACQATTSSSPPTQIQAVSAESASFSSYRTFGFRLAEAPPSPYQMSPRSFDVERRVHDLVAAELARKGYAQADTNPDFLLRLSAGTDKESTAAFPADQNRPHAITTGEIVIDAFDRSTSQQVWHGTAQAEVDPQRVSEPGLEAAVQQLLARFPARSDASPPHP